MPATSSAAAEPDEVLTCPRCVETHEGTTARIGNRKTTCSLCNRFAQAVRRQVARSLMSAHADEADRLRRDAEREVYLRVVGAR